MERSMDHRLGERVLIQRSIRLMSARPRTASIGRLINLSRSGACVVDCELPLSSLVHVDFEPHEWPKQPEATITAYVTRVTEQGVGIEWCEFAPPLVVALLQTEIMTSEALRQSRPEASAEATSDTSAAARSAAA
jgi:hypothetical protein